MTAKQYKYTCIFKKEYNTEIMSYHDYQQHGRITNVMTSQTSHKRERQLKCLHTRPEPSREMSAVAKRTSIDGRTESKKVVSIKLGILVTSSQQSSQEGFWGPLSFPALAGCWLHGWLFYSYFYTSISVLFTFCMSATFQNFEHMKKLIMYRYGPISKIC